MKEVKSYLTFNIGSEYFAANVTHVQNIIEYTKITKVPKMPEYMLGIMNLRGQVLPVIDSRLKMGMENTEITTNSCILVMEMKSKDKVDYIGVLVDGVAEVIEIDKVDIKDSSTIGANFISDFITGVYHDDTKFIMLLDVEKVFVSKEILKFSKTEEINEEKKEKADTL